MKKVAIFVFIASLLFLASCGGKKEEAEVGTTAEVVTIDFWNFPNFTVRETFDEELIAAFEAKNPNIKVNLQKISFVDGPAQINAAIVSKTAPDVIYDAPGRIMDWAAQGVLADLNSIMGGDVTSKMPKPMLDPVTMDGKYYMYPINTAPFTMAFNKTMLEGAQLLDMLPLDRADRAWNMTEYEALLTAIKEKIPGVQPVMVFANSAAGDQGTRAYIANLYGSSILNASLTEYTINNEAGVKALDWIIGAIKKGIVGPGGEALIAADTIDMYVNGTAASTILYSPGLLVANQARSAGGFETVFLPFPNDAGKPKLEVLLGGPCVFDNGNPAKVEAAKKFVAFMAQDTEWAVNVVKATGSFAVRNDFKNLYSDSPFAEEFKYLEVLLSPEYVASYYNQVKGFAEMRTYWFAAVQQAITGQATSKVALDTFVSRANSTIK